MKYITAILLILASNCIHSQDIPEEVETMMLQAMYDHQKLVLKVDTFIFKEEAYEKNDFFNEIYSEAFFENCLDKIEKTAIIKIEKEPNESAAMYFTANLPEQYNKQVTDELKFSLINYNLINSTGDSIILLNQINSSCSFSKVKIKTYKKDPNVSIEDITGSVTYQVDFLNGYDQLEMSKKDIGREFNLNSCPLKLLDVKGNYLVVENISKADINIKAINFTENSKVIKPYSYAELSDLKAEKTINEGGFGTSVSVIKKPNYELLTSTDNITIEDYKVVMTEEFKNRVRDESEVIIIKDVGFFKNKFILFTPTYTSKEVTIEY